MVLRTSRQVGKSIFNSLFTLKFAHVPMFRTIYMCPSQKQSEEFSKLKIGKILTFNPELKFMLTNKNSPLAHIKDMKATSILNDVYIKSFVTGASLKIGYAADEAGVEKVRGGSGDMIIKDESQSMMLEVINPVLDPMLSSSNYKIDINTGTPLDPDDDLCKLFDTTTQHTMVAKCHHCNKHTTFMHIKQITRKGVVCVHCLKPVDVRTGEIIPMNPSSKILGFHFNQLMMPGVVYNPFKYESLLDKAFAPNRNDYKFYNEELGVPKGTTGGMFTEEDVKKCVMTSISYTPDDFEQVVKNYKPKPTRFLVYGLDWGGGANDQAGGDLPGKSHTAEVLVEIWMDQDQLKMDIIYHKLHPLPKVKESIEEVLRKVRRLPKDTLICPDFMGGAYANSSIFDICNKNKDKSLKCLPVRFTTMNTLIEARPAQFRVDIDRAFVISKFVKKKILEPNLGISANTENYKEIKDSLLSMKSLTVKRDPGTIIWVLKAGRTNDITMALIAAWAGFCAHKNNYRDILL